MLEGSRKGPLPAAGSARWPLHRVGSEHLGCGCWTVARGAGPWGVPGPRLWARLLSPWDPQRVHLWARGAPKSPNLNPSRTWGIG